MKNRAIAIALTFVLVFTLVATAAVVMAQEESTPQQQMRQDAFFQEIDKAVHQGLITQETADRITDLWGQKPVDERPHLYQRVMNMLESKQQQQTRELALFQALDEAVNQGLITQEKADYIIGLWEQKPVDERAQLYQRVMNFLDKASTG